MNNSPNTLPGTTSASNDDPGGRIKVNSYRVFGDYIALAHGADSPLEEKVGIWAEYVRADRYAFDLDYSPAYLAANPGDATYFGAFDPSSGYKTNPYKPGWEWDMHLLQQDVPALRRPDPGSPCRNLTLEAGVKDSNYTIDLEAVVNQTDLPPDFNNYTYTNWEPHFSANYAFTSNWSGYVQFAKGVTPIPSSPTRREYPE